MTLRPETLEKLGRGKGPLLSAAPTENGGRTWLEPAKVGYSPSLPGFMMFAGSSARLMD